jgi:7,8-dihydro-6-hydroxymethylpterin-pyrophosphokinase
LAQRAFVLVPLFEIAPQSKVAGHGKTVADLLQAFQSNNKGDADAVVRIESDVWRAAADD